MLNIKQFDLQIQKPLTKMIKYINGKFPNRTWNMKVMYWEDGDYRIDLSSSWGGYSDVITYEKSKNIFTLDREHYSSSLPNVKKLKL